MSKKVQSAIRGKSSATTAHQEKHIDMGHNEFLLKEIEWLTDNLHRFPRVKRKTVLEYLHQRMSQGEEEHRQVEQAKVILNEHETP
jgi:hypothetical protein|tara:strand:- start:1016 stop:1273 length:258 start_codon:yes stop_codon:yes gene_type:complete